jgi:glycerol uptake facilitator-like aquaporin
VRWLVVSLALSVVLTVILNVGLRAFPDVGRHIARRLAQLTSPSSSDDADGRDRRVQVYVPWRGMILASLILTLLVNLLL